MITDVAILMVIAVFICDYARIWWQETAPDDLWYKPRHKKKRFRKIASFFMQIKSSRRNGSFGKEVADMVHPKPTGYGWIVRLPDGRLIETATETEALELLEQFER